MSALADLRSLETGQKLSADTVFEAIFAAGSNLSESDREADAALEIAIRLLEARRTGQLPDGAEEAVEYLAEECGLYPYIDPSHFGLVTQSVIEAHSVALHEKLYLHSKQMQVLLWLLDGDNVILSAPTSFGKSLLVDAFIARKRPRTVVMILPTIALIDECRRRVTRTFEDQYNIITDSLEPYNEDFPAIFILTQERYLQRKDIGKIDFLFVDEFYKLDPDRKDGRFETLNLALYKALPKSKQCFMAGPHIRGIDLGEKYQGNFRFVQTDYRTVTVNIVDRSAKEERLQTFLSDLAGVGHESSLVFTASPGTAQTLMTNILAADIRYPTDLGGELAEWIAANYHPSWPVAAGSEFGIAVHHGRIPRSIAQLFVRLFDSGDIKVLICTSTMIEGVNTSAANVFIYDKKINRTDFDFFSFANIRGRVGRMMRHFVGNAFLYHEAPGAIETRVDVPVLHDPGSSTDYLVMNVERDELSDAGQARQDSLPANSGLSEDILREHGNLGVELLVELSQRVKTMLARNPAFLNWRGFPDFTQRAAIAELVIFIARRRVDRFGLHTPKQVAWAWSLLNQMRSLPGFINWFATTFYTDDEPAGVDAAFQFLQACEFTFPRSLSAVEALIMDLQPGLTPSYGSYIVGLENWFRPHWMKQLDESGLPMPLSERLVRYMPGVESRSQAIDALRLLDRDGIADLSRIDRLLLDSVLYAR